ncbi:DUF5999 family protein [Rhodococcus opacus]|uniref:DUF5999 family protein n=1 Tax=Rhodococcus opacus TaxID=37919 RepID=UPI001CEC616A
MHTRSHACPPAEDVTECCNACIVADRTVQGWRLLCNGITLFDDGYYLRPDGAVAPIPSA